MSFTKAGSQFHSSSGDAPGDQLPEAESGPWASGGQAGEAPRADLPEDPHEGLREGPHEGLRGAVPLAPREPSADAVRTPGGPMAPQRSPLDWARKRLTSRSSRRLSAANQRVSSRLSQLGPAWRLVDWPDPTIASKDGKYTGFLAIGPAGVYSVTVVDQGRHRVMLAGDVVQIHGERPPHVPRARKAAKRVSEALTETVGAKVPVVPVLVFVGSGSISAHGLPDGCLVTSHREIDRVLLAGGDKISAETAEKLAQVASHPATWATHYRWYPGGQTASDSKTAYR